MCVSVLLSRHQRRRVPHALMREEPQQASVIAARRQALDEVRIAIGDYAGQHCYSEAGPHSGQETARGRMVHGDLLLQPKLLQPVLIMNPQIAAAAANERVFLQLRPVPRDAVSSRIVTAAVKRPVVDAELAADQAG